MATLYLSDVINDLLNTLSSERIKADVIVNNMSNSTQQLTDVANQICERLLNESNLPVDNVPVQIGDYLINPNELLLQLDFNDEDYLTKSIQVNNYNTGYKATVSMEEVVQSIQENIKANKLYTAIYDMACNDFNTATITNQSIFNEVNDALGGDLNATEVTNIVNQLCNKELSINDRIKIAHEVTGFGSIIDDTVADPIHQKCALGNYTGIKPYTMMLNALDIDVDLPEFKVNSLEDIANTYIDAQRWVHNTQKKVLKAAGKAIKKGFKWLSKKVKKTYSNPSDFTLQGDTVYHLDDTVNYWFDNTGGYNYAGWSQYFDQRDPGTSIVFSLLGAEYKISRVPSPTISNFRQIVVSRRLCPLNYLSVANQINESSNYHINTTTGALTNVNNITDIINILGCITDAQLFDKSMNEKDLYIALWNQSVCTELMLVILSYLLKVLSNSGNILWDSVPNQANVITALKHVMTILFHDDGAVQWNTASTLDPSGNLITIDLPQNQSGGTITNLGLINLVSESLEAQADNTSPVNYSQLGFNNLNSSTIVNSYGYVNNYNRCPIIFILLNYLDDSFSETSNGEIFLPYSHKETTEINLSIRTDVENMQKAVKTTIGIVAAVAVTLTSIKIAPKIINFKRDLKLKSMSISNLTMSAGDKYLAGDLDGAKADLKRARKYKRVTGLFGVKDDYANVNESLMLSQLMNKIA